LKSPRKQINVSSIMEYYLIASYCPFPEDHKKI
jgi:hypothetical protein